MVKITTNDVKHLSKLASLPISEEKAEALVPQIETAFDYVESLQKEDTKSIVETNQVTGLTNVWRDDLVDEARMLSQEQALKNAPDSHQGYFKVPAVLE